MNNRRNAAMEQKLNFGSPKRQTLFSKKNNGNNLKELASYSFGPKFRDQGVVCKPNQEQHSRLTKLRKEAMSKVRRERFLKSNFFIKRN